MAKGISTNTLILLVGGLALGGGALYLYSKKQGAPAAVSNPAAETQQFAQSTGISDPNALGMMQQFYSMMGSGAVPKMSGEQKRMLEAQANSAYITAGAQGIAAILGAIGAFV